MTYGDELVPVVPVDVYDVNSEASCCCWLVVRTLSICVRTSLDEVPLVWPDWRICPIWLCCSLVRLSCDSGSEELPEAS